MNSFFVLLVMLFILICIKFKFDLFCKSYRKVYTETVNSFPQISSYIIILYTLFLYISRISLSLSLSLSPSIYLLLISSISFTHLLLSLSISLFLFLSLSLIYSTPLSLYLFFLFLSLSFYIKVYYISACLLSMKSFFYQHHPF